MATVLELAPGFTDAALDMHDKLVGRVFRHAERRQVDALTADRRAINRTVRLFATVGEHLVAARTGGADLARDRAVRRLGEVRGRRP